MKIFTAVLLVTIAAAAGWFLRPYLSGSGKAADSQGRKVLY
jgi:hypothetical protein